MVTNLFELVLIIKGKARFIIIMATQGKQREKRVDKEFFLLRNLPGEYKLGKKETQLGHVIDVSN